jgi:hypothetical protein
MRRLLICAGLLPLLALAQDLDAVKAPYIEVGDCWSFSVKGVFRHGWIDSYRECVTYLDRQTNVVLALVTVQPGEREYETSYSLMWGESTTLSGVVRSPPSEFLRFPLHVGDTYQIAYAFHDTSRGSAYLGEARVTVKVIRWENVSVPAGSFRA